MKKSCITVMLTLAVLSGALSGCSSAGTSAGSGTLRVGVRDDIMNFGYQNKDTGRYYGMEIDLAEQLADRLGYKNVEFVTVQPDNRKEKLMNGEVDCLAAAYSISDERLEIFDFSAPYYTDSIKIMVEKSTLFDHMDDLKGKKIGVLAGANTAFEFAAKMNELGLIPDFNREAFEAETFDGGISFWTAGHYSELDKALEEGTVDAVCADGCIIQAYMNDDRSYLEETFSEQQYGVATQKGSKLSGPVAEAVQDMLDDKTMETLIDKWN